MPSMTRDMTDLQRAQWQAMLRRSFRPSQWWEDDEITEKSTTTEVRSVWVYRCEGDIWIVGYYTPGGEWIPESRHRDQSSAAQRVHWLNGGH